MRVVGVKTSGEESRDDVGLSICNGPFRLVREQDGSWFLYGPPKPWSVKELRQLAEGIGLVTASPDAPTADDVTVEGGVSADVIDDARDLLQEQAETNGEGAPFGGPDVDVAFGVGPVEEHKPHYGVHALAAAKLKEIRDSSTLKVPIKMLKIGDVYVPDKTFSGVAITEETHAEWKQHIWPIWKLHEDGFIELSPDGKTATVTRRGSVCLAQIEVDPQAHVYNESAPLQPSDSVIGLVGDGRGGTLPYEWVQASYDIRQLIAVNGDPKVIADGLWSVAQALKLESVIDIQDLVSCVCHGYDRIDDVEDDIDKRIEVALAGGSLPDVLGQAGKT